MSLFDKPLGSYKKLSSEQIEKNLEQELDRLLAEQKTVHYMGLNSSEIKLLEKIRGRPFCKCLVCNEDLTLQRCKHHSKGGEYYHEQKTVVTEGSAK